MAASRMAHVSSAQLFFNCYPDAYRAGDWGRDPETPAHRKAIWRAMHAIVRKYPKYALMGGKGRTPLWLYEPGDPESTLWAELSVKYGFVPHADVRAVVEGGQPYACSSLRNRRSAQRKARVARKLDAVSAVALAAKARALISENDSDAVREGLREIADALNAIAQATTRAEAA